MRDDDNWWALLFGDIPELLRDIRLAFLTATVVLLMLFTVRLFWPTFAIDALAHPQTTQGEK